MLEDGPEDDSFTYEIIPGSSNVRFRDHLVSLAWIDLLIASQGTPFLTINNLEHPRIPWSDEPFQQLGDEIDYPCPCCLANPEEYHIVTCGNEICPNCYGRLASCSCSVSGITKIQTPNLRVCGGQDYN